MKNSLLVYLLLISSLQSFSQVNLNAGLMAYYPFNGNANDASGNGNNPIFNNATLTNDRFGNSNSAYSFNGTDNYIRIPNSSSLNSSNQISICAWVKVAGFYQGTCHGNNVVMKGNMDYQTGNYKIRFDDSYFTNSQNCSISNPDVNHETFFGLNSSSSSNAPFVQTNQWYSVVYTCDGTTARIYVNCQLAGSGPANGITFTNSYDLFLGTLNNVQYPYWFNGVMDEVRIYNRAINEDEIKAYGDCSTSTLSCDNWLHTPSVPSSIRIGQLNVTGDQLTVEAEINRTAPYSGGQVWAGDIVSKHRDPADANYILRPNSGEITTTTAYYKTPDIADVQLNKTYHVAMVYDGDSLKFYRDGCLMSEIKANGNLVQNSWEAAIGFYSPEMYPDENFIGYINEVRIWNVARTQAQIQTYMNTSLPNPATQAGLLAYYTFDNLINKQGNASWNGTINGSASIDQTNPSCNPIVNSCRVIACNMSVTKNSDTTVCKGSPVKMFATGGSTYTWTPETGLDNPGLSNPIATPPVSTKYYVTVDDGSGCSKKDSVQINVNNLPVVSKSNDTSICMNSTAPLFATGGISYSWSPGTGLDNSSISNPKATPSSTIKYYVLVRNSAGCSKKDSVKITVNNLPVISRSNDTSICMNATAKLFATGGTSYSWSPGTGLDNSSISNPKATPSSTTKYYVSVSNSAGCSKKDSVKITVNNLPVISKSSDTTVCLNSSVPLFATGGTAYSWLPATGLDNSRIANPTATVNSSKIYYVAVKNAAGCIKMDSVKISIMELPTISKSHDTSICENSTVPLFATGGNSYSWTPASTLDNSNSATPLAAPSTSTKYYVTVTAANGCSKKDSVDVSVNSLPAISKSNDTAICNNSSARLSAGGGSSYSWTPASSLDNPAVADPLASPVSSTTYFVIVSNENCSAMDSVHVDINPIARITTSNDTTVCNRSATKLFASGGTTYQWSPTSFLDNAATQTPIATPSSTTVFHVSITDSYSCVYSDSVKISVREPATFSISPDNSVCANTSQQLNASGGDSYEWSPSTSLNDPQISDPLATPDSTITYSVVIKDSTCKQVDTLFTKVTVHSTPNITGVHSNDIDCSSSFSRLNATGAVSYTWFPADGLDNFGIANPIASPTSTTIYTVTGKDQNGCSNSDTVTVKVKFTGNTVYRLPNSFTPNGDGLNDCFGIKHWGQVSELDFNIYNRWGQRVFHTDNPNNCWDGTLRGEPQQADVFVYAIKAKTACGNIDKKGTVTLLR